MNYSKVSRFLIMCFAYIPNSVNKGSMYAPNNWPILPSTLNSSCVMCLEWRENSASLGGWWRLIKVLLYCYNREALLSTSTVLQEFPLHLILLLNSFMHWLESEATAVLPSLVPLFCCLETQGHMHWHGTWERVFRWHSCVGLVPTQKHVVPW